MCGCRADLCGCASLYGGILAAHFYAVGVIFLQPREMRCSGPPVFVERERPSSTCSADDELTRASSTTSSRPPWSLSGAAAFPCGRRHRVSWNGPSGAPSSPPDRGGWAGVASTSRGSHRVRKERPTTTSPIPPSPSPRKTDGSSFDSVLGRGCHADSPTVGIDSAANSSC